jgi:hypothetical protein
MLSIAPTRPTTWRTSRRRSLSETGPSTPYPPGWTRDASDRTVYMRHAAANLQTEATSALKQDHAVAAGLARGQPATRHLRQQPQGCGGAPAHHERHRRAPHGLEADVVGQGPARAPRRCAGLPARRQDGIRAASHRPQHARRVRPAESGVWSRRGPTSRRG